MLSDWEQNALGLAVLDGESPLSEIFLKILNEENFIISDNETDLITITVNNSNKKILEDIYSGVVKSIIEGDNFTYKGATSSDNSGCYHDDLTNNIHNGLSSFFGSDQAPDAANLAGAALIGIGLAALGPLGWGIGGAIIIAGIASYAYGSGMFEDPGDVSNQADFVSSVDLSFAAREMGTVPAKVAISSSYRSVVKYATTKRGYKVILEEGVFKRGGMNSLTKSLIEEYFQNKVQGYFINKIVGAWG